MDDQQALKILIALANGAHPLTGEIFAHDSPYQAPPVIRALFVAVRALESDRISIDHAASAVASSETTPKNNKAGTTEKNSPERNSPEKNSAEKNSSGKTNAGKPWSSEEDSALLAAFDAQQSISDLAKAHGRTQNGVRARLEKHGRLPPSDATRWTHSTRSASQVRDTTLPM